ncbi:MAG: polyprenyl synthetase family protein [Planctomycetota bacterium]
MSIEQWFADSHAWSEALVLRWLDRLDLGPGDMARALRHPVLAGGKRLRPSLVRLWCRELGGSDADAEAPAGAIEFVHTYSLVHDDLPCMDDDALRRGQPTTHVVFGEANAVLAGDGLLTLAFEVLAHGAGPALADMCRVLAQAAGPAGMVGGQHLDLEAEGQELDAEAVGTIHRLKTACLISAACELGALAAGADAARCAVAREYGRQLGLCFQAVDDLLDVTGAAPDLGKTPGKDEASGKATLVRALGLEGATARAREHAEAARAALAPLGLDPTSPCFTLVDWLLERRK